jgi:hypothetical protein
MEKTKREIFTKEEKMSSHKENGSSGTHPQQGMWRKCALEVNLKGAQRSVHKIISWTKFF